MAEKRTKLQQNQQLTAYCRDNPEEANQELQLAFSNLL
jgi:hypothetical protein